eukprot:14708854-Ditylum_brightwellii.AAC.1
MDWLCTGNRFIAVLLPQAHATDIKSRRSICGHIVVMAGAVIAYSTKWHQNVITSSTEVTFIQATYAAKMAKYIREIFKELNIE